MKADIVEEQVTHLLTTLKPPVEWHARMVASMGDLIGDKQLEERIAEIKAIIDRMDFRWDQGFITDKDDYLEQRVKLQQELETAAIYYRIFGRIGAQQMEIVKRSENW